MSESYAYWQAALELTGGKRAVTREEMSVLGVHDTAAAGFFRKRASRAGAFLPAAIWPDESGNMIALLNGQTTDANELWSYCAPHPISEEQYYSRMETGKWHDEDASVTESLAHDPQNAPADPAEILRSQIDSALAGVKDYETVNDDETAAKAQSLRSRLLELRGEADKKREALVRPHIDAEKAVNTVYMPLVREAKAGADKIASALSAHATRQDRLRRQAEEEDARKAALAAEVAGKPAPEPVAQPAPAPAMTVRGAYGRAASVKTVKQAKVIDQDAAYAYFKGQPEVIDVIAKLAQRSVNAGLSVPGVEVEEIKKVS